MWGLFRKKKLFISTKFWIIKWWLEDKNKVIEHIFLWTVVFILLFLESFCFRHLIFFLGHLWAPFSKSHQPFYFYADHINVTIFFLSVLLKLHENKHESFSGNISVKTNIVIRKFCVDKMCCDWGDIFGKWSDICVYMYIPTAVVSLINRRWNVGFRNSICNMFTWSTTFAFSTQVTTQIL